MIRSYRDLTVWQLAVDLTVEVYKLSRRLPRSETYGLAGQMQRAAVSVAANIAEGHGRDYRGDYLRHVSVAKGSLTELETHLVITERVGLLAPRETAEARRVSDQLGRMLRALSRRLRALPPSP